MTLIDIMLLGHWIEMRSVRRASSALDEVAKLIPDTAERITESGAIEEVPVSELNDRVDGLCSVERSVLMAFPSYSLFRRESTMSSQHQGDSLLRIVLIVLAVIVLVPLLMMVFAMPMMGMMWWSGGSGMGVSPIWGLGMMLLFFLVLLGIGYLLYRGLMGGQVLGHNRALEELRTAYARGDLTDEEFEQRRQRLQRDQE